MGEVTNRALSYASELGAALDRAWRNTEDERAFTHTATDLLEHAPPTSAMSYHDVANWLMETAAIPAQGRNDQTFGQPALTLFATDQVRVDVLFWHTGTTAIHDHAFAGAFSVLHGSSLHCHYEFRQGDRIADDMVAGEVSLRNAELLNKGAVRGIAGRGELIHSVFHLDSPTVTLVARTKTIPRPEYVYYVPCVAIDPGQSTPIRAKRLQMLDLLIRLRSDDLPAAAHTLAKTSDATTVFLAMLKLHADPWTRTVASVVGAIACDRFGQIGDRLVTAADEEARRSRLGALRRTTADANRRYFLALAMNLLDRRNILELWNSRTADDGTREPFEAVTAALIASAPNDALISTFLRDLTRPPGARASNEHACGPSKVV